MSLLGKKNKAKKKKKLAQANSASQSVYVTLQDPSAAAEISRIQNPETKNPSQDRAVLSEQSFDEKTAPTAQSESESESPAAKALQALLAEAQALQAPVLEASQTPPATTQAQAPQTPLADTQAPQAPLAKTPSQDTQPARETKETKETNGETKTPHQIKSETKTPQGENDGAKTPPQRNAAKIEEGGAKASSSRGVEQTEDDGTQVPPSRTPLIPPTKKRGLSVFGRIKNRRGAAASQVDSAAASQANGAASQAEGAARTLASQTPDAQGPQGSFALQDALAALQPEGADLAARVGVQVENLLDVIDGAPVSQEQRVAQAAEVAGAYRQVKGGATRGSKAAAATATRGSKAAAATGAPHLGLESPEGPEGLATAPGTPGLENPEALAAGPQLEAAGPRLEEAGSQLEALDAPDYDALVGELRRVKYRAKFWHVFRSTAGILITVIAVAILVASLLMPVLRLYGSSMTPTLNNGDIVLSLKTAECKTGDVVAFYYNNKVLAKRVIATSGQWVNITEDGTVFVNNKELKEPYLTEKDLGDCNITLPYQVPEDKLFVMGDHRSVSVDSRNTSVGCVSGEQIVGKLVFTVWPLSQFGPIQQKSAGV